MNFVIGMEQKICFLKLFCNKAKFDIYLQIYNKIIYIIGLDIFF